MTYAAENEEANRPLNRNQNNSREASVHWPHKPDICLGHVLQMASFGPESPVRGMAGMAPGFVHATPPGLGAVHFKQQNQIKKRRKGLLRPRGLLGGGGGCKARELFGSPMARPHSLATRQMST